MHSPCHATGANGAHLPSGKSVPPRRRQRGFLSYKRPRRTNAVSRVARNAFGPPEGAGGPKVMDARTTAGGEGGPAWLTYSPALSAGAVESHPPKSFASLQT